MTMKIRRRNTGGAGSPAALAPGQLAYNDIDDTLWIGKGDAGGNVAASVVAVAGAGNVVMLTTNQTIGGTKTFGGAVVVPTPLAATNAANKAYVDAADALKAPLASPTFTGIVIVPDGTAATHAVSKGQMDTALALRAPLASPTFTGSVTIPEGTAATHATTKAYTDAADALKAPLASPTFTGAPISTTPGANDNSTKIATTQYLDRLIGQANGLAPLAADGKIPISFLPAGYVGGLNYQGTWNATTNTPTIPVAAAGNKGSYYKVATDGATNIDGTTDWKIGDWIVSNGTIWDKIDNTEAVSSVAGRTGAIVLTTADIGGLGTIATQAANAVNLTGGAIGAAVVIDDGTY